MPCSLSGNYYRWNRPRNKHSLRLPLRFFNNTTRQKSIAFILSDFIDANYAGCITGIGT